MADHVAPVQFPRIAFLGAGSMASAILVGLVNSGAPVAGGIVTTNRTRVAAERSAGLGAVTALASEDDVPGELTANQRAVQGAGIVVVAVKPAMVSDLLVEIENHIAPGVTIISVAAGVPISTIERNLPSETAVIRAMPNTPALVGKGVTGLSFGNFVSDLARSLSQSLFRTVGEVLVIPEAKIDALSTISGSGPAYVYYLIEALTEVAVEKGFTAEEAATMVQGTFLGSSILLATEKASPAQLRRRVTSPNGTTERAIAVFDSANIPDLFARATDAALARARELSAD